MDSAKNIIIIGRKGSGKSTIGNRMLERNILSIDSNYERKVATNDDNKVTVYVINTPVVTPNSERSWPRNCYAFLKLQCSRFSFMLYTNPGLIRCAGKIRSSLYRVSRLFHYAVGFLFYSIFAPVCIWLKLSPIWCLMASIFRFSFIAVRDNFLLPIRNCFMTPIRLYLSGNHQVQDDITENYYHSRLPQSASLVLFVYRYGSRFTDERKEEMEGAIRALNKYSSIDSISALVITGCESLKSIDKEKVVNEFKVDSRAQFVANFMMKGIYCVGFPDIKALEPPLNELYDDEIRRSHAQLRALMSECTTAICLSHITRDV